MKSLGFQVYSGRNIYSHRPVIKFIVDLEEAARKRTDQLPAFCTALLELLPGLKKHHCSRSRPDGFVERLQEGTYLGHVLEHVILELQEQAGIGSRYGKTVETDIPGVVEIIFEYRLRQAAEFLANYALYLVSTLHDGVVPDIKAALKAVEKMRRELEPGPSTQAIIDAARERGIPIFFLQEGISLLQLGTGCYQRRIWATLTDQTGCIACDIASDKNLAKELLRGVLVPVPAGEQVFSVEQALGVWQWLSSPVVVKPVRGNQGKGVSLNLNTAKEIEEAFALARQFDEGVLVEEYIKGRQYRFLVVGGKVVAVAERIPAHVIGDGKSSIRKLIERVNADPLRGEGHELPLTKIKMDQFSQAALSRQGLCFDSIPEKGRIIYLRENANLSTGGIAVDVTDDVHPANEELALRAAQAIGLDLAGIDIVTPDISIPMGEKGAVIEVNAAPGIRMHHYPAQGKARNVGKSIVNMLFPPGEKVRIPVVSVTGTNGKTTTVRLISHILRQDRKTNVGMTTTDGVFLNEHCLLPGDKSGAESARMLLRDPRVDVAVLETARGGLVRRGLGYDAADVAVLTNISADHFGQDGIRSIDDLIFIKSLVVEALYPQGAAVLNADDRNVLRVVERVRSRIIYFTQKSDNIIVRRHLGQGGKAVIVSKGKIFLAAGARLENLLSLKEIPLTFEGKAKHNVENVLAAISAAVALGINKEQLVAALQSFEATTEQNPGRCNLFDLGYCRVLLDYGHNPAGIAAVLQMARRLNPARLIGVVGVPGDRSAKLIRACGKVSAKALDYIIYKEDSDPRGRQVGETAAILYEGALQAGGQKKKIRIILNELQAVEAALKEAQKGDLVVVFYEKFQPVYTLLQRAGEEHHCQETGKMVSQSQ
ncbi:MAG: cyanophycin synthetase [Dethiobacteria bacterium]